MRKPGAAGRRSEWVGRVTGDCLGDEVRCDTWVEGGLRGDVDVAAQMISEAAAVIGGAVHDRADDAHVRRLGEGCGDDLLPAASIGHHGGGIDEKKFALSPRSGW